MSQELVMDSKTEDAKNVARILYFAHGITFFFSMGLLNILPLIVNYVKRPDSAGTIVYSHHGWMIRSFWYYIVAAAIGWVCVITVILIPLGWLIWVGAWIWEAYRLIKGFIELNNNRAMP